jgi:hypothetical protein
MRPASAQPPRDAARAHSIAWLHWATFSVEGRPSTGIITTSGPTDWLELSQSQEHYVLEPWLSQQCLVGKHSPPNLLHLFAAAVFVIGGVSPSCTLIRRLRVRNRLLVWTAQLALDLSKSRRAGAGSLRQAPIADLYLRSVSGPWRDVAPARSVL